MELTNYQNGTRLLLLMLAAMFGVAALIPGPTQLYVRLVTLAASMLLCHIAANQVALRQPPLGFQWRHMSFSARVLLLIAATLLALGSALSVVGV